MLVTAIPVAMAMGPTFLARIDPPNACAAVVERSFPVPGLPGDENADPERTVLRQPRLSLTLVSGMVVGGQAVVTTLTICGGDEQYGPPLAVTFMVDGAGSLGIWRVAAVWRGTVRYP